MSTITSEEFYKSGGNNGNSALRGSHSIRRNKYDKSKNEMLDDYFKGHITSDLFLRLCNDIHNIEMNELYVKGMVNNHFMMDYLSEKHDMPTVAVEVKFRALIKEIDETPIYDNPWDNLNIVKEINAHFRSNAYIRKFYRREYRNIDLIDLINNEIAVLTDETKIEGLEELRTILGLAADIEVSENPEPIYNTLIDALR
jgi:hypothetical protein